MPNKSNKSNNLDFKKLDKEYKNYKKEIINHINRNCDIKQSYIDSFKDSYTNWEIKSSKK